MPLRSQADIVTARQAVRRWAIDAGLSLVDQTKLVTAASELARNTVEYGSGGFHVVAQVAAVDYEVDFVFAGAVENLRHPLDRPIIVADAEMHIGKDRKLHTFDVVRSERVRRSKPARKQRSTSQKIAPFHIRTD